ncbi:MAG TPA: cytochrome c peroxidase [Puia sp.]|nr:cytochrome c peroxidase [Puia sp.]
MSSTQCLKIILIVFTVVFCAAAVDSHTCRKPADETLDYIKSQTTIFAGSVHQLKLSIDRINPSDRQTIQPVIEVLKSCRIHYKKISFFLDYFYPQQGKLFNAPAKKEVEEPFMEYDESQSFQQMESILYGPNPQKKKKALKNLAIVLDESAADLTDLYFDFEATTAQVTESLHLELIRIMTLYITGYDAPDLKTGIAETRSSLESISAIARFLFQPVNRESILLDSIIKQTIFITQLTDFDHFNRLIFLTRFAMPLEEQLNKCTEIYGWQSSTVPTLNYNAKNLFLGEYNVTGKKHSDSLINLGQKLFFEKNLSGNNIRSCATCHQPDKYFTDQLVANRNINDSRSLRRNTPALFYVSDQSSQFWDGRAPTLSEQVNDVLTNPEEMNASIPEIKKRLMQNPIYQSSFHDSVTLPQIETALSAYLCTLRPMNSAFDQYMSGDHQALTNAQKNGFNLFMGKAQCGTCHFAPIFNGSTPPFFNRTEYEVLGVPGLSPSAFNIYDKDLGRYENYPIDIYKRAFKTPTVRNTAKTAPYMHNGRYHSLSEVLDFYNKGGGAGIGLYSPEQTLSGKPLHLSKQEINDIIAFLGALTDNLRPAGKS